MAERNQSQQQVIDLSHGSSNTYVVSSRHGLIPPCMVCGKLIPVKLDGDEYFRYFMQGRSISEVFDGKVEPDEREVLISGVHNDCWVKLMGEGDDMEDLNDA